MLPLLFVICFLIDVKSQQQQANIIHTTATLSQARCCLAATSSGELVFFAGGGNETNKASDRVDMFDSKKVKDLLPKKMGRFLPTRGLSKIFVK
jgi:hypothetical protein